MPDEPLLDRLRRLALMLPPNHRLSSGEVADIAAAAIAVQEHGDKLLDAADEGPQAVADFYHDASGAGDEQRGNPVANVPLTTTAAPAQTVSKADFDKLMAAVEALTAAQAKTPATTATASSKGKD